MGADDTKSREVESLLFVMSLALDNGATIDLLGLTSVSQLGASDFLID